MDVRERQLELVSLLSDRIDREHTLISSRMTWLMALNGFLFAAFGILVTNARYFQSADSLATLIGLVGSVGALSNASALYSHYWASRAIREADLATRWALTKVEEDRFTPAEALFRLAGRDPDFARMPDGLKRSRARHPVWPPWKLLHPWFLLPLIGATAFVLLSLSAGTVQTAGSSHDASNWLSAMPLLSLCPIIAIFICERVVEVRGRRGVRR
jgi:hypothetical protein